MSNNSQGDPRSGRDRRVPTRKHAFERGTLDPITTNKRPLFTIGNGILLVAIIAYGMYATGHLTQLDAFFDNADKYGKAHNSTFVNGFLTYGAYLFFGFLAILVGLIIFSFVNAHRRGVTDRRADEIEDRRRRDRRAAPREDMPSLVMPLGKERRKQPTDKPQPTPVIAMEKPKEVPPAILAEAEAPAAATPVVVATPATAAPTPAPTPAAETTLPAPSILATSKGTSAKAEAIAAAARADVIAATGPTDPSSFVPMPGKERLRRSEDKPEAPPTVVATKVVTVEASKPTPSVAATTPVAAPAATAVATPVPVADPKPAVSDNTSTLNPTTANALAEAAIAAAKVANLKAEAIIAAAKAEATIAAAKAEAAIAEAAAAAAIAGIAK